MDFAEFEALFQVKRFKKDDKTVKREESEHDIIFSNLQ